MQPAPIDYATPDPRRRMTWQRLLLLTLYYAGWSVGFGILGAIGLIALVNASGVGGSGEGSLIVGALLGGGAGAGLAYAARRTRWPQVLIIVGGIGAAAFFGYHAVHEFFGPRGFLWQLAFTVALILVGCGAAAALAGVCGLVLVRRSALHGVAMIVCIVGMLGCASPHANAAMRSVKKTAPPPRPVLESLRAEHSRIILDAQAVARVRDLIRDDATAKGWHDALRRLGRRMCDEPPVVYARDPALANARTVLLRVTTLAALHRIEPTPRFAGRARQEMLAAAAFPEWHERTYLAAAEMTAALGLGFDWLHDELPTDERDAIARAIVEKGLRPAMHAYAGNAGWPTAGHNWNLVCNGGFTLGALAVAKREPELSKQILDASRESIRNGLESFAPDGAWEEGPTYWNYASRYATLAMDGLRTALGTDFGLSDSAGFDKAGAFRMHTIGPTGKTFNFGDASEEPGSAPQMFWMAERFGRPSYAALERRIRGERAGIFDLLWYVPIDDAPLRTEPRDARFENVTVATFRSAWDDPRATYVAMKSGRNGAHHGHLDLGTFVLDSLGQRWALDLGAENYGLQESDADDAHWTYYRNSTFGHNTLVIGDRNQRLSARARILAFRSNENFAYAITDLSSAFGEKGRRVMRGVALVDRSRVLIQDEIRLSKSRSIEWRMHTRAAVTVEGNVARLTQNGETLQARIVSPKGATFAAESVSVPSTESSNEGATRLTIRFPASVRSLRIGVLFAPAGDESRVKLRPLSAWAGVDD